ncbi:hypothetical protein M407DRAFT_24538 [Tulasnella calospora MUT 4182]|uniref:Uncharacterized protein n=1 Tax=Tulasnella calospora MUT 4182 TaxID=1051891 RepID=A0A0C3QJA4_9AGAM|nr:hypothetical protein M407DRAFT_24538 [Tulasnella calospora MUT 4182]
MKPDNERTTSSLQGRNQWGDKAYPPDDVLREALCEYSKREDNNPKRLEALAKDFGLQIGLTKLTQIQKDVNIPSVRRRMSPEEEASLVTHHVNKDTGQANDPRAIADMLRLEGKPVPRAHIRGTMLDICPAGLKSGSPALDGLLGSPLPLSELRTRLPAMDILSSGARP